LNLLLMTNNPNNISVKPAIEFQRSCSLRTDTPRIMALMGIKKVTREALLAPATLRIRKYMKKARAVLRSANPTTALVDMISGFKFHGLSIINAGGRLSMVAPINIPAAETDEGMFAKRRP